MTQLHFLPAPLTASAALLLALVVPARALANDCASSADCDQGFECREVGSSGCAQPACPPDSVCPEPEPCEVRIQMECMPAQCTSDTECGEGMVCHEWTQGCTTSDCACSRDEPSCTCPEPVCDDTTVSYCTPKYVLPCTAAADCGAGFTCEEQQRCSCSGSSSSGSEPTPDAARPLPPDGAAPLPPDSEPDSDCSCEPSGQFACVPQDIECDSDSACPAGWTCQEQGVATDPGCAGPDCAAAPLPEPTPAVSRCYPTYYGGVGVDLDGGTSTSGEDDKGSGTANGIPQSPEASPGANADTQDSSACQLGHAPASQSVLSILALLGAALGLSRRRVQAVAAVRRAR